MAQTSPIYVEDDFIIINKVKEVHNNRACKMVSKRYTLRGEDVFIYVRYCVCGKYVNKYIGRIDLKPADLYVDGVFVHLHANCFHQREVISEEQRSYILETQCNCIAEYEQHSHP